MTDTDNTVQMEHAYVRPRDCKSGGVYDINAMFADRWRIAVATDDGFVFARRYIAPTPEETAAKRAAARDMVAAINKKQENAYDGGRDWVARVATKTSQQTIKPGDVVRLKSGGPEMTVDSVGPCAANCVWHVDRHAHRAAYALAALVAVK